MITNNSIRAYRNHLDVEDKSFFADFLELACYNTTELATELKERYPEIQGQKGGLASILRMIFRDTMSLTSYERWVKRISFYLPVAEMIDPILWGKKQGGTMHESDVKDPLKDRINKFREDLISLIETLSSLRHFYIHREHSTVEIKPNVIDLLNRLLVRSAIYVKTKWIATDQTKELMRKRHKDVMDALKTEMRQKLDEKKEDHVIETAVYDKAFRHLIKRQDERASTAPRYETTEGERENRLQISIPQTYFVLLLAIFLRRKELEALTSQLKGFRTQTRNNTLDNNLIRNMATHRSYALFAYKGCKRRVRTDEDYGLEVLAMQMLDELSKIPDELYKQMSYEYQLGFQTDLNSYLRQTPEGFTDDLVVHPIIRKRYEDKFGYFAVRFLDECAQFPSLRFQVHIGDYIHDAREKSLGKDYKVYREVREKICVFERLSLLAKKKAEYFEDRIPPHINANEVCPQWQLYPNPRYNFPLELRKGSQELVPAGKIGFWIDLDGKPKNYRPAEGTRTLRRGKREILQDILGSETEINIGQPTAYMSLEDIHSLVHALVIEKKSGQELETMIRKAVLDQMASPLKKSRSTSSPAVYDYSKLKRDIKIEVENSKSRLEEINHKIKKAKEKSKNRTGMSVFSVLYPDECGRVATWLADDLKRMMDKSKRAEWRSWQHQELQRNLAYCEMDVVKTLIGGMPRAFGLRRCWLGNSLAEVYRLYLEERKRFFEGLIDKFEETEEYATKCFKVFARKNYFLLDTEEHAKRVLEHPIALKRGFLEPNTRLRDLAWRKTRQGAVYQAFYGDQVLDDMIREQSAQWLQKEKKQSQGGSTAEQVLHKKTKKRLIKQINRLKNRDYTMLMMAQHILAKCFTIPLSFALDELYPDLRSPTASNIWDRPYDLELANKQLHANQVKLKDIGKYLHYARDKKVKKILSYDTQQEWEILLSNESHVETKTSTSSCKRRYKVLQKQLEEYNVARRSILGKVHCLEKHIYESCSEDPARLQQRGNENFKCYLLYGLLENMHNIDISNYQLHIKKDPSDIKPLTLDGLERHVYCLVMIRNAFAHEDLPSDQVRRYCVYLYGEDTREDRKQYYAHGYDYAFEQAYKALMNALS